MARNLGNPHRPNARGSQLSKLTGGFKTMNQPNQVTVQDIIDYHRKLDEGHEVTCIKSNAPEIPEQAPYPVAFSDHSMTLLRQYEDWHGRLMEMHPYQRIVGQSQSNSCRPYGRGPDSSSVLGAVLGGILRGIV